MTAPIRFTSLVDATPSGADCARCAGLGIVGPNGRPCEVCFGSGSVDVAVDLVLIDAVEDAVKLLRAGRPGRAEYRLARGQLAAARLLGATEEEADIAELRWVHVPGAVA